MSSPSDTANHQRHDSGVFKLVRTRLAIRSVIFILLISALVGLLFVAGGRVLVANHEQRRLHSSLEDLLNTVENTVRIAAFLGDEHLAREVASGLMQNRTVMAVAIRTPDAVLARLPAGVDIAGLDAITRKIASPFGADEVVGDVVLLPNREAIEAEVDTNSGYIMRFFVGQLLAVALGIMIVVVTLVTRPISQISRRLHDLRVEAGEKLVIPAGAEGDEIGTLVKDVNAMIDSLVELLNTERQLRIEREIEEKKFRAIVDNAETGIFLIDEQANLLSANPAFRRYFSVQERDVEEHRTRFTDILGESADAVQALIKSCVTKGTSETADLKLEGLGGVRWFKIILGGVETGVLQGIINDITDHKLAEAAAQQQAVTDALSGISNRLGFEHHLEWLVDTCLRFPQHRFALMMIDLDLFKQVNDTYGHLAGDEVLVTVSKRLMKAIRRTDFVARLGGDEFAVVLDSVDDREVIGKLARDIVDSVGQPIPIGEGVDASVGASIGITVYGGGAISLSGLMADADEAMYAAKKAGRNTYRFYQA